MGAIVASAVLIPVFGSILLPLTGKVSSLVRDLLALLLALVSFILSLLLLPPVLAGQKVVFQVLFPLGINFILNADALAVFMALCSSFISAVIILFSFDYIRHYENQNEYYCMVVLFLGAMMGIVYSANLVFLFLFWEITAIASWRLIGFYRDKKDVLKADKAFLVTVFGALLMLVGFIWIYGKTGSFDLVSLKGLVLPNIIVGVILAGILSKSATLPFHTWLPDAGVAPSPVTALLHAAVLVKIGVYVFARLFLMTFALGQFWHVWLPVLAAASALISAGAALVETDIKRIIAYSTVSQIAFIFLGLASGNMIGIAGGLLFILMHGLAKGGLFLSAGIIEHNTKRRDITKMGGLIKSMPVTAFSFLLCSFSIMGVPPFGGFFSKYFVIAGAVKSGQIWIAFAFVVGAFLTILYLFRLFSLVFLGEARGSLAEEKSKTMVYCVALLAFLSLAFGILVNYPLDLIGVSLSQMAGVIK